MKYLTHRIVFDELNKINRISRRHNLHYNCADGSAKELHSANFFSLRIKARCFNITGNQSITNEGFKHLAVKVAFNKYPRLCSARGGKRLRLAPRVPPCCTFRSNGVRP